MNEVELKDVSVPAFRKVLQFAYTGSLDMENVTLQVTVSRYECFILGQLLQHHYSILHLLVCSIIIL